MDASRRVEIILGQGEFPISTLSHEEQAEIFLRLVRMSNLDELRGFSPLSTHLSRYQFAHVATWDKDINLESHALDILNAVVYQSGKRRDLKFLITRDRDLLLVDLMIEIHSDSSAHVRAGTIKFLEKGNLASILQNYSGHRLFERLLKGAEEATRKSIESVQSKLDKLTRSHQKILGVGKVVRCYFDS